MLRVRIATQRFFALLPPPIFTESKKVIENIDGPVRYGFMGQIAAYRTTGYFRWCQSAMPWRMLLMRVKPWSIRILAATVLRLPVAQ